MPREIFGADYRFLPRSELLSFEEIARLARIFVGLGVEKIRLTGGEPLLRRELEKLVGMLAGIDGLRDLALTTNGSLLAGQAHALHQAGLGRISVSLDSLDPATFAAMSDSSCPLERVLEGISAARDAGFSPVKINTVVRRGVNEDDIAPLADRFRDPGFIVRFIEYMDVGTTNGWRMTDVVPASEILARLSSAFPLEPIPANYSGEVARRFRHPEGGEIGIIASVTQPFCANCTRARLSSEGKLYPCLFAAEGLDLRALMRSGADDQALSEAIQQVWQARDDRYSEIRGASTAGSPKVEMSYIGG